MLRALVGALIVANLVFFAFTRGWLDGVLGLHALGDREPDRLAAQVRPQSITIVAAGAPASAGSGVEAGSCFETAAFNAADSATAEAAIKAALPPGRWTAERSESTFGGTTVVNRRFRVNGADAALAAQLVALKLDAFGRGFSPCANPLPGG